MEVVHIQVWMNSHLSKIPDALRAAPRSTAHCRLHHELATPPNISSILWTYQATLLQALHWQLTELKVNVGGIN